MEDIGAGEKIFVLKRTPALRPEEVLPVYATLNELGRNWLLWMVPADATHPAGTVEVLLPGLLRGYIDRFAPSENAHELSLRRLDRRLRGGVARDRRHFGTMIGAPREKN